MNDTDIRDRLRGFIASELVFSEDPDQIGDSTLLLGGAVDSLGLMRLVSFIEDEFTVSIDDDEVTPDNFRTISDIVRLVDHKVGSAT